MTSGHVDPHPSASVYGDMDFDLNEAVTVVVRRHVKPGSEPIYEEWLSRMVNAVHEMDGYLGAEQHRPERPGAPYITVFRFDSLPHLEAFEQSPIRQTYLEEIAPHLVAATEWERLTGLEVWFDPPKGMVTAQPSPHRMALVLIGVVFILVLVINQFLIPFISHWPLVARVFVIVVIQVVLMTYWIMPGLNKRLAHWIYQKQ